ncbi:MAG TPA: CsbD family protein [Candidatus Acidoferrales bacterium]|nr:CsbD family protein [Candidatus Acidoferrales bacterium]
MNWDQVAGNWKQVKGKTREQWGKLTNDDLDVIEGRREQLIGVLQERYGWARNEAEKQADSFVKSLKESKAASSR